ncbi:hypothetical protein [Gelidibacter maritimus]|uniref:Uncharacterized protein n=1 Tax=Gelidibacter maritimus TaxID=2761487 RepID=A0A7W2M705_9FLAO|nr:hypothetical protein [Gelidibacter maritimus]MBA6153843.1 hypothetical protein [Gelidibacter maritimus]
MAKLKEILIPIAVVAVGVLGAFATQMSGSSSAAQVLEPAWIDNIMPCETDPYMCSPFEGEACTVIVDGVEHKLRGKYSSSDSDCPKPLFKPGS